MFYIIIGIIKPSITSPPIHTHAFIGENVSLSCVGDHYTTSYQWLHNGQPLVTSDRVTMVTGEGLDITNAVTADSGVYTCVAMGTQGTIEASAFLNVTGALLSCAGQSS